MIVGDGERNSPLSTTRSDDDNDDAFTDSSLHLRFHGQLLVAVCAFINLPSVIIAYFYLTD